MSRPPPSGFSGVPKAADAPVLKAMAESREERYGTADAFANELGDALLDRPRSPRFLWLGAVGIFVVVAMIGWLGPKRGDDGLTPTGSIVDSSELYWAEADIAERSDEMAD